MFFISKCSGDMIISYMEVHTIFCTRMNLTKKCNVIRFRGNEKYWKHAHGDDIQDALSPTAAIVWFISYETIYLNKSWCLILDVDGCFIYFFRKELFIGIFIFSIWLPKWPLKVTWLSSLSLVQIQVLYISNILWEFHNNMLNGLKIVCVDPIYPQYSGGFETCLALRYWFFEVLGSESVKCILLVPNLRPRFYCCWSTRNVQLAWRPSI